MLKIGSVSRAVATAAAPHLVPRGHLPKDTARLPLSHLQHLQWLMRKDNMGQDVFLLGLPGSFRRHLVLQVRPRGKPLPLSLQEKNTNMFYTKLSST